MEVFLLIFFPSPFFYTLTEALTTPTQARTNPFEVLTIFLESLITPSEAVTIHFKPLSIPSEALTTPSEALPHPLKLSHTLQGPYCHI